MAQPPLMDDDLPPTATNAIESGEKSQIALENLTAKATAKYATKDYPAAAELYSRATELQAELNGEMSVKNANLLYLYGRCLYQVAVQNSDVLGNRVVGDEQAKGKAAEIERLKSKDGVTEGVQVRNHDSKDVQEKEIEAGASSSARSAKSLSHPEATTEAPRPYFSITGDENWDDSEEELGNSAGTEEGGDDDAEDDFQNAFEVLDIARVLLEKRLAELLELKMRQEREGEAKDLGNNLIETKRLKEKLADTRDLQAEISLEAERFGDAATDLQVALDLKRDVFPFESSVIAEAHYKLSLALEFSSITPAVDAEGEPQPGTVGEVDSRLREEAASHMESAIRSCQERVVLEEEILQDHVPEATIPRDGNASERKGKGVTEQSVADVKDMIADMEHRLKELREPPVLINDAIGIDSGGGVGSLLGSLAGSTSEAKKERLEEAVNKANDLSSLVKRKKPDQPEKRKAKLDENERQNSQKKTKQ